MNLTTVEGMRSEIFVPVTPKPVFTELKKPLSECKVAFITAGGIHKKDQTPFNTSGDFTYRVIWGFYVSRHPLRYAIVKPDGYARRLR